MCTIIHLKGIILFSKNLLDRFVQEPSFYVIPGLRYEGKYKLHLIIGTVRYHLVIPAIILFYLAWMHYDVYLRVASSQKSVLNGNSCADK